MVHSGSAAGCGVAAGVCRCAPEASSPKESSARPTCEPLTGGKERNASSSRCAVVEDAALADAEPLPKDAALCERWNSTPLDWLLLIASVARTRRSARASRPTKSTPVPETSDGDDGIAAARPERSSRRSTPKASTSSLFARRWNATGIPRSE